MDRYLTINNKNLNTKNVNIKSDETITLTLGNAAENHNGMEIIGNNIKNGYSLDELKYIKNVFEIQNKICYIYDLRDICKETVNMKELDEAYILLIKNALNNNIADDLLTEMKNLDWDKKYYDIQRKQVLNKNARYNLAFSNYTQEPNYIEKKGRIICYNDVPLLNNCKNELCNILNEDYIICEGNYYYDINKCGIGWHGDKERKKIIGLRLGKVMPLKFKWFKNYKSIGNIFELNINHGDMYIMSEKATGFDSKNSNIFTLKHSAGCNKYTNLKY